MEIEMDPHPSLYDDGAKSRKTSKTSPEIPTVSRDYTAHCRQSYSKELYQANPRNEHEYRKMRALFRPVFYCMGFQGLFHPSRKAISHEIPKEYRYSSFSRWSMIILSVASIAYMIANFIVLIVAHPVVKLNNFSLNVYVILLVWLATAILLAMFQFWLCERSNRYDKVWEMWAFWARHPRIRKWTQMYRVRNIALIIAIAISITPTIIVAVVMSRMQPGTGLEPYLSFVKYGTTEWNHLCWTINFSFLAFSVFGTIAFSTIFFVTHCLMIEDELKGLSTMIGDHLDTGKIWNIVLEEEEEVSALEQLRRRRQECLKIVEAMNKTFDEIAFISIFSNVPLIVFIVYGLVTYKDENGFKMAMSILAVMASMIQVLVVSIISAWIYERADEPKKKLHRIQIHSNLKITRATSVTLTLFLSELTSESIGITAWVFNIITKEFIATVIGLTVSYIIVLVEFWHSKEILEGTHQIKAQLINITQDGGEIEL